MNILWPVTLLLGSVAVAGAQPAAAPAIPPPAPPPLAPAPPTPGAAGNFYVAVNGNDAWSGRLPAPNAAGTDGPVATLTHARNLLRRPENRGATGSTVWVRGGTYWLRQPLILEPQDSGTAAQQIFYAAYPNEKPVLSGGRPVTGWRVANGRWEVTLPEVAAGTWNFTALFVNGRRRYRPRLPKKGYYFVASSMEPTAANKEKGFDRFGFHPGEIHANWSNLQDVDVLTTHIWTMSRLHPKSVDEAAGVVNFIGTTPGSAPYAAFTTGNRYLVENVKEALTQPGEWYLDRPTGVLTYLPLPGENPATAKVIAPRLETLLELHGNAVDHQWVQHANFRGLAFGQQNYVTPPQGQAAGQAEVNLGGALTGTAVRDCSFVNCAVSQTGTYAIELRTGSKRNLIENCEMTDLGAGGVKIGEQGASEDDELVASHNTIRNCLIAHGGRLHPAAVGVWIGHSPFNAVVHNDIHDLYYTGISPGWSWGYGVSLSHHNLVAYNHIYQIGQGLLSDMGGIYTLGAGVGNLLHHNLIHDVTSFDYGGWGIYFDEGTSEIRAENNVVYNTKSAGFHQHYGKNNVVHNNIFAFGHEAQLMRTRPEDHVSFTLDHNIVYYKDTPLLGSNWSGENYNLDYNDYWNIGTQPILFPENKNLAQWQEKGQDVHSIVADPLFVDAAHYDFRLQPNSPALKLGFVPFDISTAGRLGVHTQDTVFPPAFPPPPPPPPPEPIVEDFETTDVGQKARNATTNQESEAVTARVSDEFASSGKRSLKFTDATGQKFSYSPHIYYDPRFVQGVVTAHFDVRLGAGAIFYHEWRDNAGPYHAGPSLRVEGDGSLNAGGRVLQKVPHDQWFTIAITCGLGDAANGKWSLTVTVAGQPAQTYPDLPCTPAFKSLRWFGFVSDATEATVFYLDNIQLRPVK